jgi:ABC-type multidrug transport system ATPase subunit
VGRVRAATAAVSLSRLTRVFGTQPAIVGVDLKLERGSVVLLRGPNGAGKSTLLRVIATALTPTYGGGSALGFDLVRERDEVRRRTELLGHDTRLYEDLTAIENLRFACALYGADAWRIPEVLERVGLAAVGGERVASFSHGMRQRVALARGLLRGPELLLLDEPYAGLDAGAKQTVDEVVLAARTAGNTVVLATHEQVREGLVTATVLMESGRVVHEPQAARHPVPR